MENDENKTDVIQTAKQTLKAGKILFSRILRQGDGGDWRHDDEGAVRQAMTWHFHFALRLLECLFMLRRSDLGSPAGVLFRTFSEIITRGVWIAHSKTPAIRATRARSYLDYADMKAKELQRQQKSVRRFFTNIKRSEKTIRAGLKEYQETEDSKSDPQIQKEIRCRYGENACTIPYRKMLKDIDFEGEHQTAYMMASAATHGIPTEFDSLITHEQQSLVVDYISTATDRFYVLAHYTAVIFGINDEEFTSAFHAAIQAREKKAENRPKDNSPPK